MFCQNCGNSVKDNDIYCPYCGSKVEKGDVKPEVKPEGLDKPVNEKKWVQPLMITLFVVTLLTWLFGFVIYVFVVALSMDDPLDFSNYFKPYLAIIHLVLSILCLSLGIFFKVKKYQTAKNIVIGAISTLGAILSLVVLAYVSSLFNNAPKLSLTSEYYLYMKTMEPLTPTQFDSKVVYVEGYNEDGEIEKVPIYFYLRFTDKVEIALFEAGIENSTRWQKAEVSKASVIHYDYTLVYNYETKTFDANDLEHSLVVYYSVEHKSLAVLPGTILSYMEQFVPETA